MTFAENIKALRKRNNLSQEKFAEILDITRQAVQKWETGTAMPDLYNLCTISKKFNVSVDSLILDSNGRMIDNLEYDKTIQPEYSAIHQWENYPEQLLLEYRQSVEEGKDIEEYKDLFQSLHKMRPGKNKSDIADIMFNIALNAPVIQGYEYIEPSELELIKANRKPYGLNATEIGKQTLQDKITGAWVGRICGCLLGKVVEGVRTDELIPFLKETGNFPMHRYILASDITDKIQEKYTFRINRHNCADQITCAPADDDTNYTVLAQTIVDKYGRDFTPYNISRAWMDYQPKKAYCTAERVAFRNFVAGFVPPQSAEYKNPYREWIGAQIRGDYFGYINPGNPEAAAEMAWRDASISHTKNGIYGEMFVAAMIAAAAVTDDLIDIIQCGLAQIPYTSRLYKAVTEVITNFKAGVTQKECFDKIHTDFDEHDSHDWCHTISNALIVTASLLYGGGDYGKSICMAVETGFDTDCNGATTGSILGMRNGASAIDSKWTNPIQGTLNTEIFGVGKVSISECVEKTLKHVEWNAYKVRGIAMV